MKHHKRETISPDLTPLIDVVFILLIFFLVTSVFKKEELALILNLPSSHAKSLQVDKKEVSLELSKDMLAMNSKKVSFEVFEKNVAQYEDKKRAIIIRIDEKVEYKRVVKLFDILQKHDLNNLCLVTKEN